MDRGAWRATVHGVESDMTERLSLHFRAKMSGVWSVPPGKQSVIIQSVQSLTVFKNAPVTIWRECAEITFLTTRGWFGSKYTQIPGMALA